MVCDAVGSTSRRQSFGDERKRMTYKDKIDESKINPYQSPNSELFTSRIAPGRMSILISFSVISVLGCAFIYTNWMQFSRLLGIVRCIGFVAIMGGVHYVGYRLWQRQHSKNSTDAETTSTESQDNVSSKSRVVHYASLYLLGFILLFFLLLLLLLL